MIHLIIDYQKNSNVFRILGFLFTFLFYSNTSDQHAYSFGFLQNPAKNNTIYKRLKNSKLFVWGFRPTGEHWDINITNIDLYSAFTDNEHWECINLPHKLWHGTSVCLVILWLSRSEDPWHLHMLQRVWHLSCHCLFKHLKGTFIGYACCPFFLCIVTL